MLCVLVGVAFMTLLERKLLSYMQLRKGPNKVSVSGIFQPFSDAMKLFLKERLLLKNSNQLLFTLLPVMGLSLGLTLWVLTPSFNVLSFVNSGILLFLCLSSMNVYIVMGSGWASNSVYSFLGAMRASAQTISYEISLVFILLFPCIIASTINVQSFLETFPAFTLLLFMLLLWVVSTLAETNRAPFDFAEGESELVSGFNVEYGGGLFALLFLGEYATILFFSVFTSACFLSPYSTFVYMLLSLLLAMSYLFLRGVYPRHRYDKLMQLCWKTILPISMSSLCVGLFLYWI
uniref:NADH-ubiquinone oxidoreductase chain 1 n=1 Tax=Camaena cicatricosa TaxID=1550735 RepID=A0A0A0QRU3_CAMCI|nr:NADH dehydrogenase subunit 1 [Camaena cicatricosa]AIS20792.1 NADH dehydrogenase subunit 1 [Camaena cicatricosa]